jgi:GntR family galactonate operon transcriptional repressor
MSEMSVETRKTKTEQIIEQFGKQVVSGQYEAGAALPTEAELCTQFGASRNVMREVIKVLATKKLIDAQRYRGLYVMPKDSWNCLDSDVLRWLLAEEAQSPALIHSLNEVRSLVEPTIFRWAAERATVKDLVEIEAGLMDMYKYSKEDQGAFHEADIRFHAAVIKATHNPVMMQLSDVISALQHAIFDQSYENSDEVMQLTLERHKHLFEAIRRCDGATAEEVARMLINETAERF